MRSTHDHFKADRPCGWDFHPQGLAAWLASTWFGLLRLGDGTHVSGSRDPFRKLGVDYGAETVPGSAAFRALVHAFAVAIATGRGRSPGLRNFHDHSFSCEQEAGD